MNPHLPDRDEDETATRKLDRATASLPQEFGRYQGLHAVEERSTGTVYLAHDTSLGRDVLLQVPALLGSDKSAVERFVRAARVAAGLSHPNLCPILDAGEHQGIPYLTMPVLEGRPLARVLASDGLWSPARAAEVVRKLAGAMQAAHQKNVLHRDLSAACVLLTPDGEPILTDFGMARHEGSARLTADGQVLGTPGYLAPEVLAGKHDLDGPPRDIYALGTLLYELLTGQLPHGRTMREVIVQSARMPQPPSHHRPGIPPALDAICLKALARKPEERYRGMADFAVALQDWLVRDNTAVSQEDADSIVIGILPGDRPSADDEDEEKATRILLAPVESPSTQEAVSLVLPRRELRRPPRRWYLVLAGGSVLAGVLALVLGALPAIRKTFSSSEEVGDGNSSALKDLSNRANGADALRREDLPQVLQRLGLPELVAVLGREPFRLTAQTVYPALSPDGKRLAAGNGNDIFLFDLRTGIKERVLTGHPSPVMPVAFNPSGTILASGDTSGGVRLWDLVGNQPVKVLKGHTDQVETMAFSPDGEILATGAKDRLIQVWQVRDGIVRRTLTGNTNLVFHLAFAANNKILASGSINQGIRLWDVPTGKQFWEDKSGGNVGYTRVTISPDGKRLAAGDARSTRVWELGGPRLLVTAPVPGEGLLSFTSDSLGLVTAPFRGSREGKAALVRIDAATGKPQGGFTLPVQEAWIRMGISKDAKTVAMSGNSRRSLHVVDVQTGKPRVERSGHESQVLQVAFSPDGTLLASAGHDKTVQVWDLATAKNRYLLRGHTDSVRSVAFHPDGQRIASGGWDGTIRLWEATTGKESALLTMGAKVEKLAFSPNGQLLAVACADGQTRVWDVRGQSQVRSLPGHTGQVLGVAFQQTGKRLATSGIDGTIKLWDIETGTLLHTLRGHGKSAKTGQTAVQDVKDVPGSDRLVSTGDDGTVRVWSWQEGELLDTLQGFEGSGGSVSVRAEGTLLAAAGADGTVRLWEMGPKPVPSRVLHLFDRGNNSQRTATFSPEGRYLATANADGTIFLLRLATRGNVPSLAE